MLYDKTKGVTKTPFAIRIIRYNDDHLVYSLKDGSEITVRL